MFRLEKLKVLRLVKLIIKLQIKLVFILIFPLVAILQIKSYAQVAHKKTGFTSTVRGLKIVEIRKRGRR